VLRDAKVTNFHWHDLRHTFCSRQGDSQASTNRGTGPSGGC
jgi:hypothetical protein